MVVSCVMKMESNLASNQIDFFQKIEIDWNQGFQKSKEMASKPDGRFHQKFKPKTKKSFTSTHEKSILLLDVMQTLLHFVGHSPYLGQGLSECMVLYSYQSLVLETFQRSCRKQGTAVCNCTDHDSMQFTCLSAFSPGYNNCGLSCGQQFHQYQVMGQVVPPATKKTTCVACLVLQIQSFHFILVFCRSLRNTQQASKHLVFW